MTLRRYGYGDGDVGICPQTSGIVCYCRIMSFNVCIYKIIEVVLFDNQVNFHYLYTII